MTTSRMLFAGAALAGALALAGCGREADKAARGEVPAAGVQTAEAQSQASRTDYQPRRSQRQDDGPKAEDGKPEWASNRQRSGEENAQRQFDRNGKDFGAASVDDYMARAHAFLGAPPKGVLSLTRPNGDVLYYDPKANIFLVADRQGAPRAMFKPRDGMSYWTQQKDRAAQQDARGDSSSRRPSRRYRARAADENTNG